LFYYQALSPVFCKLGLGWLYIKFNIGLVLNPH